jgi:dTDP-glucose 4,6-dehydratase
LPVNIGNPGEFTILECAKRVIVVTGSKSKLRYEAMPQDDPKQRRPDISKAKALLGWEPKSGERTEDVARVFSESGSGRG